MPKTKPSVKSSVRPHPLSKKAKKPQVQVTYEDGSSKPVPIPQVNKDVKGKGKAKQDKELKEQIEIPEPIEEDGDEEDIKPIIKEEDGVFQHAIEQSVSASSSGPSTASFVIIAGSYEKNLYGIEGTFVTSVEEDEEPELKLAPSFIFPAHLSCIKSLSVSQGAKWLVTGSDDEYIKVWDLRKRKEVGALSQHVGTITSLTFPSPSHLLSTSEDSTITVFRTRDWVPLRTLKGHSGKVNCVDVHPSGKVALSVGKDQTLRMWDLMRGRGASSLPLGFEAELVRFSKSGKLFAILGYKGIEVYTTGMRKVADLVHPKKKRLHDIRFGTAHSPSGEEVELLLSGTEDGKVYAWEVQEDVALEEDNEDEDVCVLRGIFGGHTNRVKSVDFLLAKRPNPYSAVPIVVTVSSDGKMNVYNALSIFTSSVEQEIAPIASYDTQGSRLVCVRVAEVTRKVPQAKQEILGVKVESVKKEEEGNGLRFKGDDDDDDDEESGVDEGDAAHDQEEEEEEEDEEEYEMEED